MVTLAEQAKQVAHRALMQGDLHPLRTQLITTEEQGLSYVLRIADNLVKKQAKPLKNGLPVNPFLPYETSLFVADLSDTHVCILNKFNVLATHLLLITRAYESQDKLLTLADFDALLGVVAENGGLGFFNGGKKAGASQHHKHLQWLPIDEERYQNFPLLDPLHQALAFPHYCRQMSTLAPKAWYQAYQSLLQLSGWQPGRAYNLLLTRDWLLLVPRCHEKANGISINSLGFVGSFFVHHQEQASQLLAHGLMRSLCEVSGWPSS